MLSSQLRHNFPRQSQAYATKSALVALCALACLLALVGCGGSGSPATIIVPTPTSTPRSSVRFVALGASDAVGVGATDPATQGYVSDLIAKLPPGSHALNLGISGIDLHDALVQELPEAVIVQPTLVTVWLAANDFKGCAPLNSYSADLNTMLGQLQTRTHAQVFVANLPDLTQLPAFQDRSALGRCLQNLSTNQIKALIAQWNGVIAQAASAHNAVLVDLSQFNLGADPSYVSDDGFHPSTAGYTALADIFWQSIAAHHAAANS